MSVEPGTRASDEELVDRAREAHRAHHWAEAFAGFNAVQASLGADDLERLAEAAWWTGQLETCIVARERAYEARMRAGDARSAALVALSLANDYSHRLKHSIAAGWVGRAERLLAAVPESRPHALLERAYVSRALSAGKLDEALEHAERVLEIGTRLADIDVEGLGLQDKGRVLVALGRVEEGLGLLDEAIVAAISGDLSPYTTAVVYCNATVASQDLTDYRRAAEWADAAKRWCERQSISGFPGMCRVRRAEVIRLRGAWAEAEAEARRACVELQEFCLDYAGEGFYQVGEIRLRVADLAGAEEAFSQAHQLGRDPLPGLAQLRLAQGQPQAAASMLRRALDNPAATSLLRARLLPSAVEVSIALGDVDRAAREVADLAELAGIFATHAMRAAAADAKGALSRAEGEAEAAIAEHTTAWRLWQETDAPYEAARARFALGQAYAAVGDRDRASLEVRAAQATFDRLGAALDSARLREWSRQNGVDTSGDARVAVRTFMFTDIVQSTNLIDVIGDQAWTSLLAWHDRTIRGLLAEHRGEEVDHAGDGFFVAFADARDAVECARAIRRTLREHRRQHGFAPQVRIGLHTDDATWNNGRYEGRGVHAAARIGALAGADEILASRPVLAAAGREYAHGGLRTEHVRGIREPVEVAALQE